jgi:hypothetical protein
VLYFFDSYNAEGKFIALVLILYMKPEDIRIYVNKVIEYMDTIMDQDNVGKLKISPEMGIQHLQYFPRILHECPDKDLIAKESMKIKQFVLKKIDSDSFDALACIVTNYCHYLEFDHELFEHSLNIIKLNLGAVRNELLLELVFLFLHFDIDGFKEPLKVADTINILIAFLKDSNTHTIKLDIPRKECFYFLEVREKLTKSFTSWLSKVDKVKEKKHLPTFEGLVNKSLSSIPFATTVFDEELFYKLYSNFKRIARV